MCYNVWLFYYVSFGFEFYKIREEIDVNDMLKTSE